VPPRSCGIGIEPVTWHIFFLELTRFLLEVAQRVLNVALEYDWLGVVRVVHLKKFFHGKMKPAHEKHAQRKSVRDEHQRCAAREAPGGDVAHEVVLKSRDSVVHIRAAFAVLETVVESPEAKSLAHVTL